MSILIRIISSANGLPCPEAGLYIKDFDPNALDGRGHVKVTSDVDQAKSFPDRNRAVQFWKTRSSVKPFDFRGKPNMPLTAFTVDLEERL